MKTIHFVLQITSGNKAWKFGASILLGLACTALSLYAYWELMPLFYMYLNGIETRAELSEDYGLGMLLMFGTVGLAVILLPLYSILIYARLTRVRTKNSKDAA